MRRSAFVFFDDGWKPNWQTKWMKPGFRHCFVAVPDDRGDGWNIVEWCWGRLCVDRADVSGLVERLVANDGRIAVEARIRRGRGRFPVALWPMSCVTMVKAVLGINAPLVMTPHRLYRLLSRDTIWADGHAEGNESRPDVQGDAPRGDAGRQGRADRPGEDGTGARDRAQAEKEAER